MNAEEGYSLDDLPTFQDALKLPLADYLKYAKGIFDHKEYCHSFIAETQEKFNEWCAAMNCLPNLEKCKIPLHPEMTTSSSLTVAPFISSTSLWPPTTTSYLDMINAVGHNGTCYDNYYCTQQSLAPYLHYLLGITCLILCLSGILSNLLFLPAFNVVSNRTGSTLYLTAMTLFDCIYMILFTIIVVIRYIPYDYIHQLEMYGRFSAYLIPHGQPTMELMELLSVWITVALLVDRFLYLKFGFHSKIICSRKLSLKIIVTVVVLLTTYTIPKYFEYELMSYPEYGITKVMYTTVGVSESFQNLLLHWLKVPVEMFLPYLAVAIFAVLNSIKLYDLMFKRKLSEASKEKRLKVEHDQFEENGLNRCTNNGDFEKAQKFPSLAVDCKIPIITHSLKSMENKENDIVIVTLILGFSLLAMKIPKFVLHALKSERYVEQNSTKFFQPATDFLDLLWVVSKPIMFAIAKHFRAAVMSVFCCKDFDNDAIIQVLPATEMLDIACDYVAKLQITADDKNSEDSKLLESGVTGGLNMNLDIKNDILQFKGGHPLRDDVKDIGV